MTTHAEMPLGTRPIHKKQLLFREPFVNIKEITRIHMQLSASISILATQHSSPLQLSKKSEGSFSAGIKKNEIKLLPIFYKPRLPPIGLSSILSTKTHRQISRNSPAVSSHKPQKKLDTSCNTCTVHQICNTFKRYNCAVHANMMRYSFNKTHLSRTPQ